MTVDVVIPTILPRTELLARAVRSCEAQTTQPNKVITVLDEHWEGPSQTRNRGLADVESEFVAFLDDDDELLPFHLEVCLMYAEDLDADLVYPMFTREDRYNPFRVDGASPFGRPFDDRLRRAIESENNFIPVTVLIRTEVVRAVGGFPLRNSDEWPHHANEDWGLWRKLLAVGAVFAHAPHVTWTWHPHGIDRRSSRIRT